MPKRIGGFLKDEKALSSNSGFIESSGHIAALHNNELYETQSSRAGMAILQQFGIILGHKRVVLYIEPIENDNIKLTTNTARTNLLINNESLPWSDWANEFRQKMPNEIENLIDNVASKSKGKNHSESIKERLKQIINLYDISKYRPSERGGLTVDEEKSVRGGIPKRKIEKNKNTSSNKKGGRGGAAGGIYSVFLKKDGQKAKEVDADIFPDVQWVSVEDGTREPGDIEDRAGRFLIDQNLLLINGDFRVFEDMVDRWFKEFGEKESIKEIVSDVVKAWFEQALVETVIGIQSLQNAQEWSVEDLNNAMSEEALTSAVMPRYHVNYSIKRELASKLGALKNK